MFPVIVVDHFLLHCDFRAIEDSRFIHVIPKVYIFPSTVKLFKGELLLPPFTSIGVEKVDPRGLARPAPSFIITTRRLLYKVFLLDGFIARTIVVGTFDVWIDDDYQLKKTSTKKKKVLIKPP
jgi:hypothetical protein